MRLEYFLTIQPFEDENLCINLYTKPLETDFHKEMCGNFSYYVKQVEIGALIGYKDGRIKTGYSNGINAQDETTSTFRFIKVSDCVDLIYSLTCTGKRREKSRKLSDFFEDLNGVIKNNTNVEQAIRFNFNVLAINHI